MESKKREEEMRRASRCEETPKPRINSLLRLYRTRQEAVLSLLTGQYLEEGTSRVYVFH